VVFFLPQDVKRVGFTATKKIGNAVKRNRAKRLLRAMFVEVSDDLGYGAFVFVAKESMLCTPYSLLLKSFKKALHKLKAYDS
jgi:ribonuclease P protein component